MTAEVAILNKHGVALAADSKATIGSGGNQKTFDTVNKLFTLSKVHPVGIMIFGSAEFMRYPWETIVKLYRQQKRNRSEPTVADWGDDFLKYLSGFGNIRAEDKALNVRSIISSKIEELQDGVFDQARSKGVPIPSKDYVDLLSKTLQEEIERLNRLEDFFTGEQIKAFGTECAVPVSEAIHEYFGAFEDKTLVNKATELAILSVIKKEFSPQSSGFVISGFGESEYFPALVTYETDGYIGAVHKIIEGQKGEVTRDTTAVIRPFAQRDMVQRFMNGIDPALMSAMGRLYTGTLMKSCLDVLEKYGDPTKQTDETKKLISDAAGAASTSLAESLGRIQRTSFSRPIMQMVSLLPKEELPNLAESLVALTSLKRHVSRDAETVGGPIDVCLISKGDGFIWIKRKHYFKPELNPQFSLNYMSDVLPLGESDEKRRSRRGARKGSRRSQTTSSAEATDTSAPESSQPVGHG